MANVYVGLYKKGRGGGNQDSYRSRAKKINRDPNSERKEKHRGRGKKLLLKANPTTVTQGGKRMANREKGRGGWEKEERRWKKLRQPSCMESERRGKDTGHLAFSHTSLLLTR